MAVLPSRGEYLACESKSNPRPRTGGRMASFNHGPADLIFVLPLTRTYRQIPVHIAVEPPEGGLTARSYILCDTIRSISKERLGVQAWGIVTPRTIRKVEETMRLLMDL